MGKKTEEIYDLSKEKVSKENKVKRCSKCILPGNYPGIVFNKDGICNYCVGHTVREYGGMDALKRDIEAALEKKQKERSKEYDCMICFSGGRDSSFLLYYFKKVLNLRVLAYSVDNGFIPEQTKMNMKNITDMLNVKLVIEKHQNLERCLKHHISAWIKRPSAAMIGLLCTGCKYSMVSRIKKFAEKEKIPIVILGETPFETEGHYKRNLMKINPNSGDSSTIDRSFIAGYLNRVLRNPRWILNPYALMMQFAEYFFYFRKNVLGIGDFFPFFPFMNYIRWEEKKVVSILTKELDWKQNPNVEMNWRGDCQVAILKLYLYKKILGFNDTDEGLSCLIRDKQITRQEALERLGKEGTIPEGAVKEVFKNLGVSDLKLEKALNSFSPST
jgi:hypothetical protein